VSQKPVAQKLLIRPGYQVLLLNDPTNYRSILEPLPANVQVLTGSSKPVDLIQVFVTSKRELEDRLAKLKGLLKPKGLLWVTYPKAKGKKVDTNRDIIWAYAKTLGLEGVAMVAINETWSAMRLKVV
jgi:hypothetical protein